jgi:hypothetical protein
MANWILYHTEGCHLCEQAYSLVLPLLDNDTITCVDIMADEKLLVEYQTTIPVLKSEQGQQLFWPFTVLTVREFLAQA